MGKDLRGIELGKGIRQRSNGLYEARAKVNGVEINLYGSKLPKLKKEFEEKKALANQGVNSKYSGLTLGEWFEKWFATYKVPYIKPQSVYPTRQRYTRIFSVLDDVKITKLDNIILQTRINEVLNDKVAHSTIKNAVGVIEECLTAAVNNRVINHNPCAGLIVPWGESTNKPRRFLDKYEQELILSEVKGSWYEQLIYIMLNTGMRIGEVGALTWDDILMNEGKIYVNKSLTCQYEGGQKMFYVGDPKTENSRRKIPFIGNVEEALKEQKKKQSKQKRALGDRWRDQGFGNLVFTTRMGSPVTRYHLSKELNNIVKSINDKEIFEAIKEGRQPQLMEAIYPHALRHTFCSTCFERGVSVKVTQALMGHKHFSTTLDIYTHVTNETYDDEITKLG